MVWTHVFDSEINYEENPGGGIQRRLIEHARTLYRRNDLDGPLQLGNLQSLALPFESYKLAFTPGSLDAVYAGRVTDDMLATEGRYVHSEGDANWWIPSGWMFYSPDTADTPTQELAHAQTHFFLPHRYRDPFHTDTFSTETLISYDAYDLLVQETRDALGNRVTIGERNVDPTQPLVSKGQDYRVLQPALVMDSNRNRSAVAFDALGMVVGTAVMGKPEDNPQPGDSLDGFESNLTDAVVSAHLQDPLADPYTILQRATSRLVYDLFAYYRTKDQPDPQPAAVYTLVRETHDADLEPGQQTKIQHSFSYSDGFSREIQKKIQAEPGPVPMRDEAGLIVTVDGQPEMTANDVSPRWVGSGWTVFNNKGKPVRQYEPFFTDTHRFEFDVHIGVSPVIFYDPVERVVATLHPNHTYEKVVFDPWRQITYDLNDTVAANGTQTGDPRTDADIKGYVDEYFKTQPNTWQTWYQQRITGAKGAQEKSAAEKADKHANTPTTAYFDTLGRAFLTIAHNGFDQDGATIEFPTRVRLDIEGNEREVSDANDRVVMRYDYNIAGPEKDKEKEKDKANNRIHQASMEAGERWTLNDVAGKPIRAWDSRDHLFRTAYDQLQRHSESYLSEGTGPELLVERIVYGETQLNPAANNLRGKVVQVFDQAGVITSGNYDFKGNLLRNERRLAQEYKATLDWSAAVSVEAVAYTNSTRYDALNRPAELIAPDKSVIRPAYNEANLLERIEADLRGEPVTTLFITDIDYDAKGQRTLIEYGNGVRTTYEYDPQTFRLINLLTRRDAIVFPDDCPQPPPDGWPGCEVQNLYYTYDPIGNIAHIRDDAQQTIYFRNHRVDPSTEYTYDAIYRLIEATGREHLGQIGGSLNSPTAPDAFNGFHAQTGPPRRRQGDGHLY